LKAACLLSPYGSPICDHVNRAGAGHPERLHLELVGPGPEPVHEPQGFDRVRVEVVVVGGLEQPRIVEHEPFGERSSSRSSFR
jgi:hypothetical protein